MSSVFDELFGDIAGQLSKLRVKKLYVMGLEELVEELFEAHQWSIYEALEVEGGGDRVAKIAIELDKRITNGRNIEQFEQDIKDKQE